MKGVHK